MQGYSMRKLLFFFLYTIAGATMNARAQGSFSQLYLKDGQYCLKSDGKPFTGQITEKYPNSHVHFTVQYNNGRLDGPFTEWYENGLKKAEGRYR